MPQPSRRSPGILALALSVLALPGGRAARAADACALLGGAIQWSVIVSGAVALKESSGYHEQSVVMGPICASTISVQNVRTGDFSGGDLVALATAGTAVRLRTSPTSCLYCAGMNDIRGDVITGGGLVSGGEQLNPPFLVDTSGTHPRLADCQAALADAAAGSAQLAALPPTQVYGDVRIGPTETFTIDARGGAVINMDSLVMNGSHDGVYDYPPVVRACLNVDPGTTATLKVLSNDGDQVVINVPRLTLGSCAQPDLKDAIINVPGAGKPVTIGNQVFNAYSSSPVLLAPERRVKVRGSAVDLPPLFAAIYAQRLSSAGNVAIQNIWGNNLPCHPYP